jgi:putative flippase GtrA
MGLAWFGYNQIFDDFSLEQRENLSVALGIVTSIFTNFLLNDTWTWGDRQKGRRFAWIRRLIKYYLAAALGGFLQWGIFRGAVTFVGSEHYLWANLLGIGAGTVSNYILMHFWSFRSVDETPAE